MIPVTVGNLSISNIGFVVFLKCERSQKNIPIFIGGPEAQAIALRLNNVNPPRPMTHDLMKDILDIFEARLESIAIHSLREGTFFARLMVKFEDDTLEIDARPSDAIALALRYGAPMFVAEEVMEEAGIILEREDEARGQRVEEESEAETAGTGAFQENQEKSRLSTLKQRLAKAVIDERYEEAAELRDEIRRLTNVN